MGLKLLIAFIILAPRVLRLVGQWVVAGRDAGVMEKKFDFFDWLSTVTKLKTVYRSIRAVIIP